MSSIKNITVAYFLFFSSLTYAISSDCSDYADLLNQAVRHARLHKSNSGKAKGIVPVNIGQADNLFNYCKEEWRKNPKNIDFYAYQQFSLSINYHQSEVTIKVYDASWQMLIKECMLIINRKRKELLTKNRSAQSR